jgi:hypothetical protein
VFWESRPDQSERPDEILPRIYAEVNVRHVRGAAGRSEQEQVGALFEPTVARGQGHDLRFADHRQCIEVEAVEGLSHRQPVLGQVALDAATAAIGDFVFGQRRQEAGAPASPPCRIALRSSPTPA